VADAVLQAFGDPLPVEGEGTAARASVEDAAKREARQRLLDRHSYGPLLAFYPVVG
jgi:hypothetical protein